MSAKRCKGKTKAGNACKVSPLTAAGAAKLGLPENDQAYCSAHHPELPASARFGSPAQAREAGQLGGRPALPRPTDVARQLVEENVVAILRPHFRTLGYDVVMSADGPRLVENESGPAKMHGESKDGDIVASPHDDLAAMMAAADKLLDRIYGRPKQATELTGAGGAPITPVVIAVDDEDRASEVAQILAGAGAATT
jgi:hypothetical protein